MLVGELRAHARRYDVEAMISLVNEKFHCASEANIWCPSAANLAKTFGAYNVWLAAHEGIPSSTTPEPEPEILVDTQLSNPAQSTSDDEEEEEDDEDLE